MTWRRSSKQQLALINQPTMPNPTTGHNNQLTLGNGGHHQKPTRVAKMQTQATNNTTTVPCDGGHVARHSIRRREDA
jgi:hypothetical protein